MQSREFSIPGLMPQIQVLSSLLSRPGNVPVILIVDASGSMQYRAQAVIDSVKKAMKNFAEIGDGRNYFLAIIEFADTARLTMPLSHVLTAPEFDYRPDGWTKLYSTVYESLAMVMAALDSVGQVQKDQQITIAVFSDGDDNKSPAQDLSSLQQLARNVQNLDINFQLQTFGIGISAEKLAAFMGFPLEMAVTVEGSPRGVEHAMEGMTSMTTMTPDYAIVQEARRLAGETSNPPPVPPPPPVDGVDHTLSSIVLPEHKDNLGTDMDPMQSLYGNL